MTTAQEIVAKLRGFNMGIQQLGDRNNRCDECGYDLGDEDGRYHPYEFCVLVKAGVDPEAFIAKHRDRVGKSVIDLPEPPDD